MKKVINYLRPALYSIRQNKLYALFCIAGTALTFIFVALALQLVRICTDNYPPMVHADRTIRLPEYFTDSKGYGMKIQPREMDAVLDNIKDYQYASLWHSEMINVLLREHLYNSMVGFVNADFWQINRFEFIAGRPFTKDDCTNRKKSVVVTEGIAQAYFNNKQCIGEKMSFQGNEYEVTGVVKRFSLLSSPSESCGIWAPYVFNKFLPSSYEFYTVDILAPPEMPLNEMQEKITGAILQHFRQRNLTMNLLPEQLHTLQEDKAVRWGGELFRYGSGAIVFLLLLIPALNIVSLNMANTRNRAGEIALRKAFGASLLSSFMQIMTETLILVAAGAVTGVALATPVLDLIQQNIIDSTLGNISLVAGIDYAVVFAGVTPAMLLFSLLSGGLPAYIISRRNISTVLKGGDK
ncbi:MAG: ABC transporter permease [Bacteroidales bacterium]|jgi:hypothetical protein|nr:ABC transporter permease [Bacteroidales bacterium]